MDKDRLSPLGKNSEIERELKQVILVGREAHSSRRQLAAYDYLGSVLRLFGRWDRRGLARKRSRKAAKLSGLQIRGDTSPIRILIDCTAHKADRKQRSRWSRCLEFAVSKNIAAGELKSFLRANGGIAGCAGQIGNLTILA